MAEGAVNSYTAFQALATGGFVGLYGWPAAFVLGAVVAALWAWWQPKRLVARLSNERGTAPRLAGWLLWLTVAGCLLAAMCFNVVRQLLMQTKQSVVVALTTTIAVVAFCALLVVISRPALRALSWAIERFDDAVYRRWSRLICTPRHIFVAFGVLIVSLLVVSWFVSIRPRIGPFSLGVAIYPVTWSITLIAALPVWHYVVGDTQASRGIAGVSIALAVTMVGSAIYVRHARPELMLRIWGDAPVAGAAIDRFYNLDTLRQELHLQAAAPRELPNASHPNLVLITIDTVRADRLAAYRGPATTPTLSGLASRGALFEWAFSPSNVTRRSLPTIATGLPPRRIRGRVTGWALKLDPRHITVAERLRAAGYDTAGFFCCKSQFGASHRLGLIRGIDHLELDYKSEDLGRRARSWLGRRSFAAPSPPLFMWMHFIEPHNWHLRKQPARRPGETRKSYDRRRYDASLSDVDKVLARIFAALPQDNTVFIVTSDHGEGLGDHGERFHSTTLYNAQVRIPLIIAGPGIAVQRIKQPVGLVHLARTMLELAGYEGPAMPEMDGRSLAPLLRGHRTDDVDGGIAFSEMVKGRSVAEDMFAIVAGGYKLIVRKNRTELYNIAVDGNERRNLASKQPERVQRLRQKLEERRRNDLIRPF